MSNAGGSAPAGEEIATDYVFDRAGRLDELSHSVGSNPLTSTLVSGYGYSWNARNQLTGIDFLPDGVNSPFDYSDEDVTYDYDDRGQLTGADYEALVDEVYAYDENGNRTDDVTNVNGTHDYTTGANNRLLSDGVYDYLYDNEGNRTRRTEIATGDYVVYGWDHRNRLVSVTTYDANGTPSNFTDDVVVHNVTYAYDADNRLIRHFVDPAGDEGFEPAEQTIFIYRGGQVEMQFEGTGGEGDISLFDLYHRYLWGPGVDMLLADERIGLNDEQTDFEGQTFWTLTDHLNTIRDVVDVEGNLRLHRAYDAFGNVVDASGNVDVDFGYTGKFYDEATGLQNNQNRWYDAAVGRWVSEDPIGFDGGDANLSRYVDNQATFSIDPTGLAKPRLWKLWKGIKVMVDDESAEMVLDSGKRIKIRNYKFSNCDITLPDLEQATNVSKETIERLRKKFGDNLSIKFDENGQPDFSKYRQARIKIPNPGAGNYRDQAWRKLQKEDLKKYEELYERMGDFDWHHAADGSLDLIDKDLHSAFQHTGLSAVLKEAAGCAVIAFIPGAQEMSEGRVSDAGRAVFVEVTPLSFSEWISSYWSWLYDTAADDLEERKKNGRKIFP